MNKVYKTDLHCHTSEMSGCAKENAVDTINKYVEYGYTSLVISNHCENTRIHAPLDYRYRYDSYEELINKIYDAIDYIREVAGDRLYILSGFELCNSETENDYLIYGLTREQALGFDLCFSKMEAVSRYVRECGGVIIQAHPFRIDMTLVHPELVDGYEIHNSSDSWLYVNCMATLWAQLNCCDDKILTAGNDHHNPRDIPTAGILTSKPITNDAELIRVLKEKDFLVFHGTQMNCKG